MLAAEEKLAKAKAAQTAAIEALGTLPPHQAPKHIPQPAKNATEAKWKEFHASVAAERARVRAVNDASSAQAKKLRAHIAPLREACTAALRARNEVYAAWKQRGGKDAAFWPSDEAYKAWKLQGGTGEGSCSIESRAGGPAAQEREPFGEAGHDLTSSS